MKDLSTAERKLLADDWNRVTAPYRASANSRRRKGVTCPACKGTGEIGIDHKRFDCLRCNGRGVDPLP